MSRPKTIKLPVADVTIETYQQEIPSTCPKCGADLLEPDALTLFEYVNEGQGASIDEDGEIDWTGRSAEGGCSTIDDVWLCKKCDTTLASGQEVRHARDPVVTVRELIELSDFCRGELEIMSLGDPSELDRRTLGRLLRAFAEHLKGTKT